MSSPASNPVARWLGARLSSLLGLGDLQKKLSALETQISRMETLEADRPLPRELDPAVAKGIIGSLQRLTEGLGTIDKKISSYRTARFLSQVSDIYPKSKSVIFAGSSYLGGNIKYAYLSFQEKAREHGIPSYFLPYSQTEYDQLRAANLPCLPHVLSNFTPEEAGILLNAKVLVLDNYFVPPNWRSQNPYALLHGAKTVQLWHGIPLKEIGLEVALSAKIDDPAASEFHAACGPFDVFLAGSASSRPEWKYKFAFKAFAPIGYPRNDVFFRDLTQGDLLNVDMKALGLVQDANKVGKPVIVYVPTFRDSEGSAWFNKADIASFADACAAKGWLFYVNLHPGEQESVEQFRARYPNVNFVNPHSDVYPIVKHASVLITDYSSLAYDFLLVDRPIVFYRPDHNDYVTRSRHLIKDHDQYDCGPVTTTINELVLAAEAAVKASASYEDDPWRDARHTLQRKLFDYYDGLAASRLSDIILSLLDSDK